MMKMQTLLELTQKLDLSSMRWILNLLVETLKPKLSLITKKLDLLMRILLRMKRLTLLDVAQKLNLFKVR